MLTVSIGPFFSWARTSTLNHIDLLIITVYFCVLYFLVKFLISSYNLLHFLVFDDLLRVSYLSFSVWAFCSNKSFWWASQFWNLWFGKTFSLHSKESHATRCLDLWSGDKSTSIIQENKLELWSLILIPKSDLKSKNDLTILWQKFL